MATKKAGQPKVPYISGDVDVRSMEFSKQLPALLAFRELAKKYPDKNIAIPGEMLVFAIDQFELLLVGSIVDVAFTKWEKIIEDGVKLQ